MSYITETYSLKYYGECMNARRQRGRVEIWAKGAVGASYPRGIGDIAALSLAINGNEDIDAPVVKTILSLTMIDTRDEPQAQTAYTKKHGAWEEFYTPDSTAYLVKLFTAEDGDEDWTHRWSGYITPDNWTETIGYRGGVSVTARDNLGHLQDFDFDLAPDADGMVSAYDVIDGAFAKIAFPMDVVIGCDDVAGSRALLYEAGHATGSRGIYDALFLASELQGGDWWTALTDVLDSLGLTIRFADNNTVVVTEIRNLPLCGGTATGAPQEIEFLGPGTRILVPAYRSVKITTDFDYEREVSYGAKVNGTYGPNEAFAWSYYDTRARRTVSGSAYRCAVSGVGPGWSSPDKAFVNPAAYRVSSRGGGGVIVDTDTTALLVANASDDAVKMAPAAFILGYINSPAGVVSLETTAAFTLSGRYLYRAGSLTGYEWTARYVSGGSTYWWNGSQWKDTAVWKEVADNKMDFSAPMNLRDLPEGGVLTVFVRNLAADAGFCVGVSGLTLMCESPSSSLDADIVTVVNNGSYNVRAERSPRFGCLSKAVAWNTPRNYPNAIWRRVAGKLEPFPYETVWSDGEENLPLPAQWARQTLMFHHSTLQRIEGTAGVLANGLWRLDRPTYYKGHYFLQQGGTLDLLTGRVNGVSLREYVDFTTLWLGGATVAPLVASFPQAGGAASFLVTCAEDREWLVTGLPDWISADTLGGTGGGVVTLTARANDYAARSATIYIAGVAVAVAQAAPVFGVSLSPDPIGFGIEGGGVLVTVEAPAGEGWRIVSSDSSWLLVNGGQEHSGEGLDSALAVSAARNDSGAARTATLSVYDSRNTLVQTVTVAQSLESGGTGVPRLYITSNVESPSIAMTVNGVAAAYSEGMEIPVGAAVGVSVSKEGYTPVTDSFEMTAGDVVRRYTLIQVVDATIAYPSTFTSAAQEVAFVISDPSNHGWVFNYGGLYLFLASNGWRATGSGVTLCNGDGATGRGDAVVYLTFKANSSSQPRSFNVTPLGFKDNTTGEVTQISLTQLGSSGVLTPVTSVSIPAEKTLTLGQTYQLEATVLPSGADNKTLTWESSDPSKVAVDQTGRITARAVGSATITARATDGSGCQDTCYVTVQGETVRVSAVYLDKITATIGVGGTLRLNPTIEPPGATDKSVAWQSSAPSVATVSGGVVTGVAPGTARITVTTNDGGKTAICDVTVTQNGTISVESVTAKSSQTSASAEVTAARINPSSIQVSESASWITGATADTSGGVWYIRLTLAANTSTASRSATVTVNATDTNGDAVGPVTFTVTQNGKTSSDVPCSGMAIAGADAINNSGNSAVYGVDYSPSGCTQSWCVWSLVSGDSYASIETLSDGRLRVTVKPGASGDTVRIKAVNYYNSQYEAVKDITVTYISSSAIEVSPATVTVQHDATSDNTPVVDATGVTGLSVQSVSGFITSASIQNGRVVTVFGANTGGSSRSGSVTLQGFDANDAAVTAVVGYTQAGVPATGNNIAVTALKVEQVGGKVRATVRAAFHNGGLNQKVFGSVGFTLTGKDSSDNVVFTRSESLPDKTVASMSTETEIYDVQWTGTVGMSVEYDLTFTAGGLTATYTGDGDDVI